jgi:endonuclease YncB( thermonuclease family)
MYEYAAVVYNVVDGDTIDVMTDLGFGVHIKLRLRVARINAPEMRTEQGKLVKALVIRTLPTDGKVKIRTKKKDPYGRWIAEVIFGESETNLSDFLLLNES